MIINFRSKLAQDIYDGSSTSKSRKFPGQLGGKTLRLLDQLNIVTQIDELLIPPSNHLEKLKGDLSGYWSLRINRQWRIIFQWDGRDVSNVDILDYH
jgi:proteic killer suppression protein